MRVRRTRSQRTQADQLGQIGDDFQRAAAAWAQVGNMIGRRPVAPYTRAAGQAFGMRHAHAPLGAVAASGGAPPGGGGGGGGGGATADVDRVTAQARASGAVGRAEVTGSM